MSSDEAKVEDWQREAAKVPIKWTGDLDDDCTAGWAEAMRVTNGKKARSAAESVARLWLGGES